MGTTHIIGVGGSTDNESLGLDTRARNHIPNILTLDKPPAGMQQIARLIEESFHATCVSATAVYDCVGLAFGNRRTSIDIAEVPRILVEDEFHPIPDSRSWHTGDVVLYRKGEELRHVAVIHTVRHDLARPENDPEVTVVSAWGESGEYIHDWKRVHPLLGEPSQVWSQRKALHR